ncbi:MAG: preprotein translocase subunit SecE [Candidatus Margulisiibacteriota bacterium]
MVVSSAGLIGKVRNYFKETVAEMKKVTWPDRRYVTVATIIVLVIVLVLGAFITTIDLGFSRLMILLRDLF